MFEPRRLPHGTRWRIYCRYSIAARVMAVGALIYAIYRLERSRKTLDLLLSECERLASETPDSAAP